jgi:hypothetical protein
MVKKITVALFFVMIIAVPGEVFTQQVRGKTTTSKKLWDFSYHVWSDGCVTSSYLHVASNGRHRNDIGYVNSQIDYFNTQVRRLRCIDLADEAYQQEYFNRSSIGDLYYVSGTLSSTHYEGATKYSQGGPYTIYSLAIWEVKVVAK